MKYTYHIPNPYMSKGDKHLIKIYYSVQQIIEIKKASFDPPINLLMIVKI